MESQLVPHVPRLLLEWQRDAPGESWRAIEGTLVFIDLSGFTAMSEKLARKGKVGAEEVTEVLGSTFSELLRVAYDVGGGLLKFGGDALLLFFSGDEHAERGTYAAAEMRRTLRRIGRIKTSAGNVTLRMTVGVHSGDFHFFLVGDSHKELVVTGPEASQTVAMESAAEAGEILLSANTSSRIDRSFLGEFKDGGCLLAKVPPAPHHEELVALPEVQEVTDFVPTAIRKHLLGGGEEAEHRQVTVGFIQFEGTDELIDQKGPDEASARLHSLISAVQAAVQEFGICFLSTDIASDGGKIILTAGAPHATENDDDRMLRALLRVQESDYGLGIRIGVHQGHVFTGSIGPLYRRTYTVMGDAVNTAARVMSQAEPGDLLATSEVLERSDTLFSTSEIPAFQAKGKARPIIASRVLKPLGPRVRKLQLELPLVGRDAELRQLLEDLEAANRDTGKVVEIVGESGMGKSRLLAELKGRALIQRFEAIGQQYESAIPYFAFRSLMRSLCEINPDDNPTTCEQGLSNKFRVVAPELLPWLPLVGAVMDVEIQTTPEVSRLDPDVRKAKLHEVTFQALQRLVQGPALWVFEDVEWFDPSSQELLRYLLERAGETHWLMCLTTRSKENPLSEGIEHSRVESLNSLTTDASVTLARAADKMLLPQHASVLARRSGGNPLFVLELVASYGLAEDLGSLPDSVEAVVSARIDHLEPSLRALLRNLSVFGRETDLTTIREVAEEGAYVLDDSAWGRLAEFVEVKDGAIGFRQSLFRDVAYEGLPFGRRRALHGLVAKVLEGRPDANENAELLSLHFHSALIYDKTWQYSLAAAKKAEAKFAFVAAASFYRRATECVRRLPNLKTGEVVEVWESLGLALKEAGQFVGAIDAYARARNLARGDSVALARLSLLEGYARERLGMYREAMRWITRGLRIIGSDSLGTSLAARKIVTRLKVAAAELRFLQGKLTESVKWGQNAVEEAEALGDPYELGRAYYSLLSAYTASGNPLAITYGERALKIFEEQGDLKLQANVLNSLGMLAYYGGAWDRALDMYERCKVTLERAGYDLGVAITANNIAEILSDQGHYRRAEEVFKEALATARATKHSRLVHYANRNLARAAARDGRNAEAQELYNEVLDGFRASGASADVEETKARIAEAFVFEGEFEEALRMINSIDQSLIPTAAPLILRLRGYASAQSGDLDSAVESLKESLKLARQSKQDFEVAFTLEALSRLTPEGQARQYRDAAAQIFDRLGFVATPAVSLAVLSSSAQ